MKKYISILLLVSTINFYGMFQLSYRVDLSPKSEHSHNPVTLATHSNFKAGSPPNLMAVGSTSAPVKTYTGLTGLIATPIKTVNNNFLNNGDGGLFFIDEKTACAISRKGNVSVQELRDEDNETSFHCKSSFGETVPTYCVVNQESQAYVGSTDGNVYTMNVLPKGKPEFSCIYQSNKTSSHINALTFVGAYLAAGSFDGYLAAIDIESHKAVKTYENNPHIDMATLVSHKDNPNLVFACGACDHVYSYDLRESNAAVVIKNGNPVYALAILKGYTAVGTTKNTIKIYDQRRTDNAIQTMHCSKEPSGKTTVNGLKPIFYNDLTALSSNDTLTYWQSIS